MQDIYKQYIHITQAVQTVQASANLYITALRVATKVVQATQAVQSHASVNL